MTPILVVFISETKDKTHTHKMKMNTHFLVNTIRIDTNKKQDKKKDGRQMKNLY